MRCSVGKDHGFIRELFPVEGGLLGTRTTTVPGSYLEAQLQFGQVKWGLMAMAPREIGSE
jgi:hypothetical protein